MTVDTGCCHSCGIPVGIEKARCPLCYVALGAASRAPSPLRASAAAVRADGALARVLATAPMPEPPWAVGVQCPSCEATVAPGTERCSHCQTPLPDRTSDDFLDDGPLARVIVGPWPAHPIGDVDDGGGGEPDAQPVSPPVAGAQRRRWWRPSGAARRRSR